MIIEKLELRDFRNYEELSIEFDKGINIIYGKNAQGKTNILEALFAGCTSKSHRSAKDREMIRFGKEEAHVKVTLRKRDLPYRLDLHIKKNRAKGIAVNGTPIRKVSDLFGTASLVFFSPEDLGLIKNGPSERRRFLDLELCQLDRLYTHDLISYNRVEEQKNKILKDLQEKGSSSSYSAEMLSVYNGQLVRYGTELIRKRKKFIEDLSGIMESTHFRITGGGEQIRVSYEQNVKEEAFEETLLLSAEREIRNGMCLVGPHRDDFGFKIGGTDLRRYGSQGQQRTAALSLKLSELELVESITGEKPVLLLDDVLSELDRDRQDMLLDSIHGIQTVLTCTGIDDLLERRFAMDRVFLAREGTVRAVSREDMEKYTSGR